MNLKYLSICMTDCNAAAKTQGLSGAVRKTFMKNCLNGRETLIAPGDTIQQEKNETV